MLRTELRRETGPALTRSGGERRLVKLIRAANLPQPVVDARVAGFVVDAVWPAHRVIVELDGYLYHGHRGAFERDHRRDVALDDARHHVIRITGRQLVGEPFGVIAHIARVLDRHASPSIRNPG